MAFRAAGIEGLRGVAAVMVVVAHTIDFMLIQGLFDDDGKLVAGHGSSGLGVLSIFAALGVHGVTIFFVISGFLLYRPFVQQVSTGSRTLMVKEFLRNRFLRIFPGYLVVFVIAAFGLGAVVTQVHSDTDGNYVGRMTDPLLIFTNLTLTQGYLPQGQLTGLGASWSLVPELAFYLLLPVIWVVSRRLAERMRWQSAVLVPVLAMLVLGLFVRVAIAFSLVAAGDGADLLSASTWRAVVWHSIVAQGDLFALGMLVAVLSVNSLNRGDGRVGAQADRQATRRAGWLIVACIVAALPAKALLLDAPVIGVAAAGLIVIMMYGEGRISRAIRAVLAWRPVDRAGMISYSLYLWHVPVIFVLRENWPDLRYKTLGGFAVAFVLVFVLTWVLSEITYALIERPALSRKRSMIARDAAVPAETPGSNATTHESAVESAEISPPRA